MSFKIIIGLIGGLGLFLYGMQKISEGLQKAAGDRLRQILELFTSKPIIAVLTGTLATVLVQSSSTTTVMVVSFVNAGLMNLAQAIGTIMGANIGTTITAQIVSFELYDIALPAIGIGFLMSFLCKRKTYKNLGLSLLGFGILFLGLNIMSDSIYPLREYQPFLNLLISFGQTPILGVVAGAAFTAIIQSSSATSGLVIAFASQGLLNLESGLALILGANIGTCITAVLASIGGTLTARRAAIAHVLFNVIGVVVFLFLLTPFAKLVALTSNATARQLANAHTIFNITTTILLFPFIHHFVGLVQRIVPGTEEVLNSKPQYLNQNIIHSPAAIMAASKETVRMAEIALDMLNEAFEAFLTGDSKLIDSVNRKEIVVNELERSIIRFLTEASQNPLSVSQSRRLTNLMHSAHDIERVADHATNIIELAETKIENNLCFSELGINDIKTMHKEVTEIFREAINLLKNENIDAAQKLIRADDIVDQMEKDFRDAHIRRLNEGTCTPEAGVIFLDIVSNLERIADHANNLAEAVKATLTGSPEVEFEQV